MKKLVFLLMFGLPFLVEAQGFQVSLQGQKQQAMAGAGTGLAQDGASLFYNPGAVPFLQNSISVGATPVISHGQYTDGSSSVVSETKSPVSYPFTGYIVFGEKKSKFKYGFAAYTPFGSTIDWEKGWTGRFVMTHLQLFAVYLQPTASYKINEKLGIGAGFVYGTGKVNLQQDMPLTDNAGNFGKAELKGNAKGYGFNAGIYYKPTSVLSLGLTYHSGVTMDVNKGEANFTVPASLAGSFPSGDFSTSLSLPKIITLGAGITATKKLTIAFDASLIGWNTFDSLVFDFKNNTPELQDTRSARNYQNGYALRLGGQYSICEKLDARAGIKYLVSPVKDGYVSPDVPDATHFNYSIGLGYKLSKHLTADASFTFQRMKRSDTNIQTQLSGTYSTDIYMPGLSINYNF
ncbi:MAG TPA: outer membrane protein transport protein [Chitinophagaceae bacterium]